MGVESSRVEGWWLTVTGETERGRVKERLVRWMAESQRLEVWDTHLEGQGKMSCSSFLHSTNTYWVSTMCQGARDIAVKKTDTNLCLHRCGCILRVVLQSMFGFFLIIQISPWLPVPLHCSLAFQHNLTVFLATRKSLINGRAKLKVDYLEFCFELVLNTQKSHNVEDEVRFCLFCRWHWDQNRRMK